MSNSTLGMLARQEKTRREILHKSDLIPPLPDFVVRLLTLLNQQETEPRHLEQHLQSDQVLVAKMLAMVNSPFYGVNRSIRTIKDAVMVLGFRGVRSLVLATSTAKFLQRDYTCYGHDQKGLWSHAACVGAGAKFLAKTCKLGAEIAEQMFVAGLLHDIGKLLLVGYLADGLRQTPTHADSTVELEQKLVGIDHTEAGALVLAKWNLSTELQDTIKAHHTSTYAGTPKPIAIVRVADGVARQRGYGYLPGRAPGGALLPGDLATLELNAQWSTVQDELVATMEEALAGLATLTN